MKMKTMTWQASPSLEKGKNSSASIARDTKSLSDTFLTKRSVPSARKSKVISLTDATASLTRTKRKKLISFMPVATEHAEPTTTIALILTS